MIPTLGVVFAVLLHGGVETAEDPAPIRIEILRAEMPMISSATEIIFTVENLGSTVLLLDKIYIKRPDDDVQDSCEYDKGVDLNSGKSRTVTCRLSERAIYKNGALLFYREGTYPVQLTIDYSEGIDPAIKVHPETISLEPKAPLLGLIAGGFTGVLVLPLFRRLWRKYRTGRWRGGGFEPAIWITWVLGFFVVTIFVTVVRYSTFNLQELPIRLEVKDFYGAVLFGLLFEPVGRWLAGIAGAVTDPAPESDAGPRKEEDDTEDVNDHSEQEGVGS